MSELERFAMGMRRIPRKKVRCEIYGTVKFIVDEDRAKSIFLRAVPSATSGDIYESIWILQERIDDYFAKRGIRTQ